MQIRRFSSDIKTKIPEPTAGMYGVPILLGRSVIPPLSDDEMAARFNGLPILVDGAVSVVALYFDTHARMHEHSNSCNTLFVVLRGQGHLRLGGPAGATRVITAGDAILWPPDVEHMVWTDDVPLDALAIELPLTPPAAAGGKRQGGEQSS